MHIKLLIRAGVILLLAGVSTGCVIGNRPRIVSTGSRSVGITFYLDGAGNIGFGKESLPLGLADGGYRGYVEHFIWTTYLGPVLDQMWLRHNRREGELLARKIEDYLRLHPGGHVNLVGLSAGTGIAVFALEALRPGARVDHVVMLSSSLSDRYDLSRALSHVNKGIFFFWSPDDPILKRAVPIIGTVDRAGFGAAPAGRSGARLPEQITDLTRRAYQKVYNVRWSPDEGDGWLRLKHAGSVQRGIIRDQVAPILMNRASVRAVPVVEYANY